MIAKLTGTGIWSGALRYGDPTAVADAAAEVESLGYTALWIPDAGGDVFTPIGALLAATQRIVAATGILNLWMHSPEETAQHHAALTAEHGDRFLVGIGVSHGPMIDRILEQAGTYQQPLARTNAFLDGLDAASPPLAAADRAIAALGPKMLGLARDRSAGAHPYLVTPEHTALAREILGPDALLAVEQGVVLEADPTTARATGRQALATYLGLPNYVNNWFRLGFDEADVANGGSDRLIDALFAWGDEDTIRARLRAHHDAGADHVCIQTIGGVQGSDLPLAHWRALAPAAT
ncbi:MAG: LLM class F420-dependent oxidoreductase [Ilumatobacteraceae bacterium]